MLYNENIEEIVFNRHEIIESDELIIISGYVGPHPVKRLSTLPIPATVIYGMFGSQSISSRLDTTLKRLNSESENTTILYSEIPVHSKCYIWKKDGKVVHALIGSANFSTSGLQSPLRETLAETTKDTFNQLDKYADLIRGNSITCEDYELTATTEEHSATSIENPYESSNVCVMTLYNPKSGVVPEASGLNWGNSNGHTVENDAYIAVRKDYIRRYPNLFPPKKQKPLTPSGKVTRQNDTVEIVWDDGTIMQGLLEGTQEVNGKKYPKQLSSYPRKNTLGKYIRDRMGLESGVLITREMLQAYCRDFISINLIDEDTYYIDFSPIIEQQQQEDAN